MNLQTQKAETQTMEIQSNTPGMQIVTAGASEPLPFDPMALIKSAAFMPSSRALELESYVCTSEVEDALNKFGAQHAPYHAALDEWTTITNLYRNQGLPIADNPITRHFDKKMDRDEKPYWDALSALDDVLNAGLIERITDALHLVGVSDLPTIFEVCRCVLKGGAMWDGEGFTQGQIPVDCLLGLQTLGAPSVQDAPAPQIVATTELDILQAAGTLKAAA